ncbi:hypothetical protein BJ508DRAFT_382079 [Ascobolus immersus RN42]|uniref:PiggyBac transposable element-derived protein domain-containing protein n=1 Tax=Ascobolus immersus RN42 TaxID=1160509 RepID=A0A3N4H9G5_ASCIM|nr:hypothetical protein BJ508DRAFT_382079 [Ascobolus immersus RN42]
MAPRTRSMAAKEETRQKRRDLGNDEDYQDRPLDWHTKETSDEESDYETCSESHPASEHSHPPATPLRKEREFSPLRGFPNSQQSFRIRYNWQPPRVEDDIDPAEFSHSDHEREDNGNEADTEPEEEWEDDDGFGNLTDADADGMEDDEIPLGGASGYWNPDFMPTSWRDIPGPPADYEPPNVSNPSYAHEGRAHVDPMEWDATPNRTNLPAEFSSDNPACPLEYFRLFFCDEVFQFLAERTNQYAEAARSTGGYYGRPWTDVCPEEMKTWVGINLYLAYLNTKVPGMAWQESTRIRFIADYMSKTRFEQIRRYFHIYGPTTPDADRPWYYRFEPLMDLLRPRFKEYFIPVYGKESPYYQN